MKKIKIFLPLFLALIILTLIFFTFYRDANLTGGLTIRFDKNQIMYRAEQLVEKLNIPTKDLKINTALKTNNALIRQVQQEFGFKKGNQLLRDSLPGYYWQIQWFPKAKNMFSFNSDAERNKENNSDKLLLEYDNSGNLLQLDRKLDDSTALPSFAPEQARTEVEKFISKFGTIKSLTPNTDTAAEKSFISGKNEIFNFKIERRIELPHRVDYQYTWAGKSSYINDDIKMEVTVSGNVISKFKVTYLIPEKYTTVSSDIYQSSIQILFYFIIIILITVLAYRKVKAYEIGFRTAFIASLVVMICSALNIYTGINDVFSWVMLIPLILGPLFFGAALFITWAVSETIVRETWKEKLIPVDLLTKGYFTHSKVGKAVLTGLTFGISITSLWLILLYIIQNFMGIWNGSYDTLLLSNLNSTSPFLNMITKSLYTSLFTFAIFFNLVLSGIKRRFRAVSVIIILSGIIWGIVNSNDIHPIYIGAITEIILGLIFTWSFYKFDGLTTLVAIISFYTVEKSLALFTLGHSSYLLSGYSILFILVILIIYCFVSIFSKDKAVDFNSITPAFAINITERQRLQRELEIARDVQMSFLPREIPTIAGLDIATICLPALEVGGDYYDFVLQSDKKLGVIIGDVSGKGTQAAFYMTLTKGFLKALTRSFYSPAQFLKEMNTLFFDNVDRGTFISMIYGVFDLQNNKFTLARAGHNPVIVRNSSQRSAETLNPTGLAIGMEKGTIFNNTIKEIETNISKGDVFIFYTDGFTEAMNKEKEEFGEERLIKLVTNNTYSEAGELLDMIIKNVKSFMGKAPQHDDMTMVIVKIKN